MFMRIASEDSLLRGSDRESKNDKEVVGERTGDMPPRRSGRHEDEVRPGDLFSIKAIRRKRRSRKGTGPRPSGTSQPAYRKSEHSG